MRLPGGRRYTANKAGDMVKTAGACGNCKNPSQAPAAHHGEANASHSTPHAGPANLEIHAARQSADARTAAVEDVRLEHGDA
jgi:hypothetical protein